MKFIVLRRISTKHGVTFEIQRGNKDTPLNSTRIECFCPYGFAMRETRTTDCRLHWYLLAALVVSLRFSSESGRVPSHHLRIINKSRKKKMCKGVGVSRELIEHPSAQRPNKGPLLLYFICQETGQMSAFSSILKDREKTKSGLFSPLPMAFTMNGMFNNLTSPSSYFTTIKTH